MVLVHSQSNRVFTFPLRPRPLPPAPSSRFVHRHIYYFGISRLSGGLDFGVLWHLIRPRSLRIWFLFVSTDTAVWLTSLHASRQISLPLAWLWDVTPARKGLAPSGILWYIRYQMPMPGTHKVLPQWG